MSLSYATDIFGESTAQRIAARLIRVIETIVSSPDISLRDIDIRTDDEVVHTISDLPGLVTAAAKVAGAETAFSHEESDISYAMLAAKLADTAALMGTGAKPEAVLSVSLMNLVPGILPALGAAGYGELIERLLADAAAKVAGTEER
jgi:hypothetical protein